MRSHEDRLEIAREILEGLSVGDALGEAMSYQYYRARDLDDFTLYRAGAIPYTDDTEMALGVFETLQTFQTIDQDGMSQIFASRFTCEPDRGYGKMARRILADIAGGSPWRAVSSRAFGRGSFGNGAAMRVAPLGGYFADELGAIPEMARRSAEVTHYHPEGGAGAIAVAVAVAVAFNTRQNSKEHSCEAIWEAVLKLTPDSAVRTNLVKARSIVEATPEEAARELGNGFLVSAQDTVPFCIWSACRSLVDFREAFFSTVETGGDCDTNAAIVGGIVAARVGSQGIPDTWRKVREPLQWRLPSK